MVPMQLNAKTSSKSVALFATSRRIAVRPVRAFTAVTPRPIRLLPRAAVETESSQMTAAEVRSISCRDVNNLMQEGWVLLDVRPPDEIAKARVLNAVEVPLFLPDPSRDPGSLLKQASAFGMGGWWLGGTHMVLNEKFMEEVEAKVPRNSKVIIGCQKGLRSLAACERLALAGYSDLAWINGGFDTYRKGDLKTVNDVDARYGGIGGLSEVLGWTEVQQEERKGFAGAETVLKFFAILVLLDGLLFAYEQFSYLKESGQL